MEAAAKGVMGRSILYLVPDLVNRQSGIARHARMVCLALLDPDTRLAVVTFSDSMDDPKDIARSFPSIVYESCGGSKFRFVWRALEMTVRYRPGIVSAAHPNFSLLGWVLARCFGARWVCFIHGIDVWKPLPLFRRWALQHADQIISVSHFTARRAIEANGIPSAKVRVLYNCLDPQFEERTPLRSRHTNLSLLTVARMSQFERYKGHDYVIRALPRLRVQFPDLVYHIVGDGSGREDLERLAVREGVEDSVRFHGTVSEEALMQYYACSDVFIMPSTGEGFGFVFLEAMAHGIPAIGGNLDATPEVIVNGVTGFLVNPTSVESIVESVSALLSNKQLREDMGRAAARHVSQNFGFQGFQRQLKKYLAELCSPGTSADCASHAD